MPSGRVHDIITATTTPVVGFVGWKVSGDLKLGMILISAYIFASTMFNGDLDIISRPYRRWSLLRFIWIPYQKLFEHRSIWTHGIIIGTVIRILWISPILFIILYFTPLSLNSLGWINCLLILWGLELGNTIHTLSDKFVSAV